MHPNLPSTHLGHTPEMTPAGMVYNGKCATDQGQRRGVKRSVGPDLLHTFHCTPCLLGSSLVCGPGEWRVPEMTPAGMVYNGKCAIDQAQRRGVKRSAGPYTAYSIHILGQQRWGCGWSQF